MKICVDRTKCTGMGLCESLVPDVFEVDDSGDLRLLATEVPADLADQVRQAVGNCPTAALRIEQ